ncbi:Zn-dependent hydrolase [Peptoniphilus catoniae]|uniref:Zn-dependent hydrolase n=1 Tax=Peptoniphilus catoniae TaxID=1660341 RepID=UPI0010FE3415|nr:Zn-dependent hydrolase [Peptoniphilus catoniae]
MNAERFMNNLKTIAGIGRNDLNGIDRLAFSPYYYQALKELEKYLKERDFQTRVDAIGNLFVTYNPDNKDEFIMLGSHLDTVKNGGLYDGALGVFAGLEALESIKEKGLKLNYGLILAVFNAEEGSEMGGTFGSRTICGRNDFSDKGFEERLKKYDLTLEDIRACKINFDNIKAFIELHIEQGPTLYNESIDIGVVNGIVGITRYDLKVFGESNHAGTTMMKYRNDPIKKLPKIIKELFDLADEYEDPFVMTIGDIKVVPGMYNVIPREANLFIEVRDMSQDNINKFFEKLGKFLSDEKFDYSLEKMIEKPSVKLDKNIMSLIEKSAQDLKLSYKEMSSGAGHDAKEISHLVPTGMIFVPSVDGISHSPKEYTKEEDLEKGVRLLIEFLKNI